MTVSNILKCLIVSEQCIKVFDRDGNFLYKFVEKGEGEGDGEFNTSCCLSGHLLV